MTDLVVGRRYARALFLIARERGLVGEIATELDNVRQLFEDAGVFRALTAPGMGVQARRSAVAAISHELGLSRVTGDFLALLAERRRLAALPAIRRLFESMMDAEAGRVRACIVSAVALSQAAVEEIRGLLRQKTGREIVAQLDVAPELLGGLVIHAGGRVYDASVRRQLERLGQAMAEG